MTSLFAQRTCATYEYNLAMMQTHPEFAQNQKDIERATQEFIKRGGGESLSGIANLGTPLTLYRLLCMSYTKLLFRI